MPTTITALPTPPTRQDPSNFAARGDAFMAALPTLVTQMNAATGEVEAATAVCQSAAQVVNVSAWVSGTTYAAGVAVYDTTNFLTYRRRTAGAGTTRPGLDGTNWALLTGFGDVDLASAQTIPGVKTFTQPIVGSITGNAATSTTASNVSRAVSGSGLASGGGALTADRTITVTAASEAQAQAGTDNTVALTPLSLRQGLNAAGTAPVYACRAWVNFNGTGTVAIRASGNVSSLVDNGGNGDYTINFQAALPDANYAAVFGTQDDSGGANWASARNNSTYSTTALRFIGWNFQGSSRDLPTVNAAIFR